MNYPLARELYGQPWCMDSLSLPSLLGTMAMIRSGVIFEVPQIKYNTPELLRINSEGRLITEPYQLNTNDDFKGVGVININGPITVNGGASSLGMSDISAMMYEMNSDNRIVGFVVRGNSGGGASAAVDIMVDTINEIKKTKKVYGSIPKGGMAASAMYMILAACNEIHAESGMSIVGSNGTMIQFDGVAANSQDSEGNKRIRLYATKSTMKNKAFEEALNNDNYEPIISTLLDPICEHGLARTLANRPLLAGTDYADGNDKFAKDAIGTFIDGIASFNEVVNMVLAESQINTSLTKNNNSNSKSVKMNKAEIKNAHPETYAEIVSEGVNAEKERVASWMVYSKADPEAVSAGIESGADISPSQREKLMVKMSHNSILDDLKSDSTKPLATKETPTSAEVATGEEVKAAFDFKLN